MNILVCVKQVPDTNEIRIDPVRNTLIREGVPSILNPYDSYALEAAARLRDAVPGSRITVLSMGPAQASAALRECLAMAADSAWLASDRAFGGSDTLATSYILSCAIRRVQREEGTFDAIFCGKQATDGDTAQVGPEIAEHLGLPQVTYALEAFAEEGGLRVLREAEDEKQIVGVKLPCLVTFTKPAFDPRFPTVRRLLASRAAPIHALTAADLAGEIDLARAGLSGSPTKVRKTFVPPRRKTGRLFGGETADESAAALYEALCAAQVL